ncbi:MAG TPA: YbaB/EbfC family nucleoid-associated protein [Cryptosporangiaceae bacterium]|nr:YbaB/EbfC family nucleoid-associated protein [Cryptosporangiaceae bacterium]
MQARVDELMEQFEKMRAGASDVMAKVKKVQVTEKSRDGLVSATVGPRGQLVRLDLDPRIYRRPDSRELADTITETVQRATAKAQEQGAALLETIIDKEQLNAHLDGDIDGILRNIDAEILRGGE